MTTTDNEGSTVTYAPSIITTTVVYTNTLGDPVTITEILSNPSLLPEGDGGGASAFFHMKGAVAAVFAAVGLVIIAMLWMLIWYCRSRHKRERLEHDSVVAAIMDGRRSSGRLTLIDDDEDYSGNGHTSSVGHRRVSQRSHSGSNSSSHGGMSPIDSAGQAAFRVPFPPVSLLAASYSRPKSSSSQGRGGSGGGRYQHIRNESDPARRSPSPPPRFSQEYYRDPFSDSPSVPLLYGTVGGNKPPPAIMDEFEPVPLTLTAPISPDQARRDLFTQKREFVKANPGSSSESLITGVSTNTPRDWEVQNVFDEELGSMPKIRKKLLLSVQNPGSSPAPSIR
jgi:hypothetical protein